MAEVQHYVVFAQLDLVHHIALGLNDWHLTMPILQLRISEGGLGQASLSVYAQWAHSHMFVSYVLRPERYTEWHTGPLRRWAFVLVIDVPPPPVSNEHYPFEPYFLCT